MIGEGMRAAHVTGSNTKNTERRRHTRGRLRRGGGDYHRVFE
jgi:hypothetical protein